MSAVSVMKMGTRASEYNREKTMDLFLWRSRGRRLFTGGLTAVTLAAGLAVIAQPAASAQGGDDAMAILKAMSDYIDAQQSIALLFNSDIEVITPELQKLQFASSASPAGSSEQAARDPARWLRRRRCLLRRKTGHDLRQQRERIRECRCPGTIDQLIEKLRGEYGVDAPGADLLLSHGFDGMTADVIDAKHIGRGVIDGVECEHLAFRDAELRLADLGRGR